MSLPSWTETASVLGLEPLTETAELELGVQVLCLPSFHPECGLRLTSNETGARLSVHSAKRSIWAHLNAVKGTPGFGTAVSWVRPAIAIEPLTPTLEDFSRIVQASAQARPWLPEGRGLGLDGMPVHLELAGEGLAACAFELWFSADSETPPGRLVRLLCDVALARCSWEITSATLTDLARYS